MIWKIIIEIILAILTISFGANFWDCIKSKRYLKFTIEDYNYLSAWAKKNGKDDTKKHQMNLSKTHLLNY